MPDEPKNAVEPGSVPRWVMYGSIPALLLLVLAAASIILYPRPPALEEIVREYRPRVEAENAMRQGLAEHLEQKLELAEGRYRNALERVPGLEPANYLLGVLEIDAGRPAEAITTLDGEYENAGLELWRANAHGVALARRERFEEALAEFDRALALAPDYAQGMRNRALALRSLGRHEEALAQINECLKAAPEWEYPYLTRAAIRADLEDYDGAIEDLERFNEAYPDQSIGPENIARIEALRTP